MADNDFIDSFYVPGKHPARRIGEAAAFVPVVTALDAPATSPDAKSPGSERKAPGDSVQVYVRVRPLGGEEHKSGSEACVRPVSDSQVAIGAAGHGSAARSGVEAQAYTFHHVFGPQAQQQDVYSVTTKPCVDAVLQGFHATVFAYGQTGSGKTFTMVGDEGVALSATPQPTDGVIARAVRDLFQRAASSDRGLRVSVSAAQIYCETVTDLLSEAGAAGRALELREDGDGSVYVDGLQSVRVANAAQALDIIARASRRRETASTLHNEVSSRSHAVFTLTVERGLSSRVAGGDPGSTNDAEDESKADRARPPPAQLNFCDLAGSERLGNAGMALSAARVEESIAINTSLLALAGVIAALTEGEGGTRHSHVPYRNSKLTRLLQNSLGGNCRTSMIATVSPSASAVEETRRTLRFSCRATYVKNRARRNDPDVQRRGRPDTKFSEEEEVMLARQRGAVLGIDGGEGKDGRGSSREGCFFNGYVKVPLKARPRKAWHCDVPDGGARPSQVWVQAHGLKRNDGPVGVLLHGYGTGASSDGWAYMIPALVAAGYRVVAIDFPGFGRTGGESLPSRSQFNCSVGGPVDIVLGVLDHFGVRRATLLGYDWGGGIAWSTAAASPKRVAAVVAFHATYTVDKARPELPAVRCPSLVLWAPPDSFHPLAWGKKFAKLLRRATLQVVKIPRTSKWREQRPAIRCAIMEWLATHDPAYSEATSVAASAAAAPAASSGEEGKTSASDASGGSTSQGEKVEEAGGGDPVVPAMGAFGDDVAAEAPHAPGGATAAVTQFRKLWKRGKLPHLYAALLGRGGHASRRPQAIRLLSSLPVLSPLTLSSVSTLTDCGLWRSAPAGWDKMVASPRYFPGRRVLVRLKGIQPDRSSSGWYLGLSPTRANSAAEAFTTHRATLVAADGEDFVVSVEVATDHDGSAGETKPPTVNVKVPRHTVFEANQRHEFGPVAAGGGADSSGTQRERLQFEDSVQCDYMGLLMRARMAEVALALGDVAATLDFGGDSDALVAKQLECVKRVRRVLNITRLQDGVDRRRESRSNSVARLITYGQGHCHGLTSCMAAVLHAFSPVLGIDVAYRNGDCVHSSRRVASNIVDRHHWLELALRPSMRLFVCDLSYDSGGPASAAARVRASDAAGADNLLSDEGSTKGASASGASRGRAQRWRTATGYDALATPAEVAYAPALGWYPFCRPLAFCSPAPLLTTDDACPCAEPPAIDPRGTGTVVRNA